MKTKHNFSRKSLPLTSLFLICIICTMLLTSCAMSCNMGSNTPLESSKSAEDSKLTDSSSTDKATDVANNQKEPHIHKFGDWAVAIEPTCTDAGEERRACTCGESETRTIEAKRHSYTSVVTAPTCTERGYTTYTCECGESYVDTYVSATDHNFGNWETTKDATCEDKGEQKRECKCGEVETKYISATGHSYSAVVTKPTCAERGYTTFTCDCGDFYTYNYVSATGHTFGNWETTKDATCEGNGEQKRECVCGEVETKDIPATGHSYKSVVTYPTCEEKGYTTYTCHCGDSYVDKYVDETGHSFGEWKTTSKATCTENGEQKRECDCGEIEAKTISATGHSHKSVVTDPTCTEKGYTTHTCACGDTYQDTYVDATGHTYEAVVTAPTCEYQGYTTYTCFCGNSYVDNYVKANGHNETIDGATEPTCTETGLTEGKKCSICKKILIAQTVIPAIGHTEIVMTGKTATCTEAGLTEGKKCSVCGKILITQTVIPAIGHKTFSDWKVTQEPTETTEGIKKRNCTKCGYEETQRIPTKLRIVSNPISSGYYVALNPYAPKENISVTCSGGQAPYSYQWQIKEGTSWKNLYGGTSSSYPFDLKTRGGYEYRCKITDAIGNVIISNSCTIAIYNYPSISCSTSISGKINSTVQLSATVTKDPLDTNSYTYWWLKQDGYFSGLGSHSLTIIDRGSIYLGTTTNTLTIKTSSSSSTQYYTFRIIAPNGTQIERDNITVTVK